MNNIGQEQTTQIFKDHIKDIIGQIVGEKMVEINNSVAGMFEKFLKQKCQGVIREIVNEEINKRLYYALTKKQKLNKKKEERKVLYDQQCEIIESDKDDDVVIEKSQIAVKEPEEIQLEDAEDNKKTEISTEDQAKEPNENIQK